MAWRSQSPTQSQRRLIDDALDFVSRYAQGLPSGLQAKLRQFWEAEKIRLRRMKARARYLQLPLMGAWIELDPRSLGLESIFEPGAALADESLSAQRREQMLAKVQEQWVYLGSALVHEGVHALEGLSWNRARDELSAYNAECRFLSNVFSADLHPIVRNAAKSLHADAVRDAFQREGLRLEPLAEKP